MDFENPNHKVNIQNVENLWLGDSSNSLGIEHLGLRSSKSKRRAIARKLKRIQRQADRAFEDVEVEDSGFLDEACSTEM